jgi:hypothetical protein
MPSHLAPLPYCFKIVSNLRSAGDKRKRPGLNASRPGRFVKVYLTLTTVPIWEMAGAQARILRKAGIINGSRHACDGDPLIINGRAQGGGFLGMEAGLFEYRFLP